MAAVLSISLWVLWWQHYHFLSFLFYLTVFCITSTSSASELKFTKEPARVVYVSNGNTAKFEWEYYFHSDEKHREIEITWKLHNADKSTVALAFQYHASWDSFVKVYNTRYQTRLSTVNKGFNTTLVLANMTREDDGVYGCQVLLRESSFVRRYVRDKVQVIVTERPQFTTAVLPEQHTVSEGQDFSVTCTAHGLPQPNVTWVWMQKGGEVAVASGVGRAVLSMRNVKRDQNGVYQCRATNNPNEAPITMETRLNVKYIPFPPMNTTVVAGNEIRLQCIMGSEKAPLITWHRTAGSSTLIRSYGCNYGNQILVIPDAMQTDAGIYTCTATTVHDGKLLTVTASAHVTVKGPPPSPTVSRVLSTSKHPSVTLQWPEVQSQDGLVTMYTVYQRTHISCDVMSPWKQLINVTMPAILRHNVARLKPEVTYQFLVTSWNKLGESTKDESKSITVQIPASKTVEVSANKTVEVPAKKTVQIPAKTTVQIPTKKTVEVPANETVEVPANETVEVPANKTVEVPANKTVEVPANKTEDTKEPGGKGKNHQQIPAKESTSCQTFAVVTAASVATNLILLVALVFFVVKLHRLSETLKIRKLAMGDPKYESSRSSYRSNTDKERNQTPPERPTVFETLSATPKDIEDQPFIVYRPRRKSLHSNSSEIELQEIPDLSSEREQCEPLVVACKLDIEVVETG